jgi:serine/threonine protein kinase
MIDCPGRVELRKYLTRDGSLAPDQYNWIEAHIEECMACLAMLDELTCDDVPTGTTMPDLSPHGYRVYKFLGSGAFGEVWLAQDLNLPRVVAVKTLKLGTAPDERRRAMQALRRDAHLLTPVVHPNVVRVYAWVTVGEQHYLIMQYVAGGSLADLLKAEGSLDWQRAARYVADVGEGLLEVHAQGIVHRDVKPSNILWDPKKDEAILTDFGVGAWLAHPATVAGSLPYMAPEAYDGKVSPALDVYSLASTLFHLVTGFHPFSGTRISDLKEQIALGLPDPDTRCVGLPEPLERIIRAGLTADPERRPSLKEFVSTLRGTLNQLLVDTFTMNPAPAGPDLSTEVAPGAEPQPFGGPTTELEPRAATPVELRLIVSRQVSPHSFVPVAASHPQPRPGRVTRDMKKVPAAPDQVRLRTGDRVRIEVGVDRPGYLTVFNVGPSGSLNLLYPDRDPQHASTPPVEPDHPLHIVDVEMTPPAGRERLLAVWTRQPLSLPLDELHGLVERKNGDAPASRPYVATRDMKRVQQSVRQLKPDDWHAVVLELEHGA